MGDLEKIKLEFDAERTKLDEKKQMLNADKDKIKLAFDEQKNDFDAKTRDFDQQIQTLQHAKQTKLMKATLVQKGWINNVYAELIAQIDIQKGEMHMVKGLLEGKKGRIEGDIENKKGQIEVEKGKIVAAKCKLQVKKLNIQNDQYALSEKKIENQTKVTKLMKEQFEMFESKIDDEKIHQIIEAKKKFLQTEFVVNIEVLEKTYKFLMELEKKLDGENKNESDINQAHRESTNSLFVPVIKYLVEPDRLKSGEVEDEETRIRVPRIGDKKRFIMSVSRITHGVEKFAEEYE